jgi:capsid protein
MAKRPTKVNSTGTKRPYVRKNTGGAGSINASTIHDGAQTYYRQTRTSEVLGNNNLDPKNIVTDYDRWNLVNKSRYFVENIPIFKSIVEDIATYAVGEAYLPIYQGSNKEWGDKAREWLVKWYDSADAFGGDFHTCLWLASCALDRDGDIFLQLTYAENGIYPQINLIPCHRISTTDKVVQSGTFAGKNVYDGVILNARNRPIGYNVLVNGDGGEFGGINSNNGNATKQASVQLSTNNVLCLYEPKYPIQMRGYPTLSSCIPDLLSYKDIREYEIEAIKQAAAISIIEKNPIGGVLPGQYQFGMSSSLSNGQDPNQPMYWKYYNGGTVRYFGSNDPNSGLEQMKNDRPGNLTQTFLREHLLKGAMASIGLPLEMAFDMSGLNSANTRAILAKVDRKLLQRQTTLYKMWSRSIKYALAVAIKQGFLPPNDEWYKWTCTYPKSPSIDLGRDSKTDIDLLRVCGNTLGDIFGKNGEQFEDKTRQRIAEVKFIMDECKKSNVPFDLVYSISPNPPTAGSTESAIENPEKSATPTDNTNTNETDQ